MLWLVQNLNYEKKNKKIVINKRNNKMVKDKNQCKCLDGYSNMLIQT